MAQNYCPNCGQKVAPSDNFCMNCGNGLSNPTSDNSPSVNPQSESPASSFSTTSSSPSQEVESIVQESTNKIEEFVALVNDMTEALDSTTKESEVDGNQLADLVETQIRARETIKFINQRQRTMSGLDYVIAIESEGPYDTFPEYLSAVVRMSQDFLDASDISLEYMENGQEKSQRIIETIENDQQDLGRIIPKVDSMNFRGKDMKSQSKVLFESLDLLSDMDIILEK